MDHIAHPVVSIIINIVIAVVAAALFAVATAFHDSNKRLSVQTPK